MTPTSTAAPLLRVDGVTLQYKTREHLVTASYRVSFDKIHNQLPGFNCAWDAKKGAAQLHEIFSRIVMDQSGFDFRAFTRLKQLKHLIATQQIDDEFFWRY